MFERAAKLNWEGIISKRADAPYRSERNENWLKIKAVQKGKFLVVGFVKDRAASPRCTSASGKARSWFTWVRLGRAGLGLYRARSGSSSSQCQPEIKADKIHQETEGDMGRTEVLRGHRVPRHHIGRLAACQFVQRASPEGSILIASLASDGYVKIIQSGRRVKS